MQKIGFIGLGIMGSRMAFNLQKAGYELIIYNRTRSKASELLENGAVWSNTIAEVAKQSDIIITMVSTPEVIRELHYELITNLREGSLWINSSTVNPSFSVEIANKASQHGICYLDAPVAGTKGPAAAGELLFLIGGNDKDISNAQPLLDIMGKKSLYLGEVGKGSAMKMLINQLLGAQMIAFAEALAMGQAMGLKKPTLFDVLTATPVVAPVMAAVRSKLEHRDYETNFPLKWIHKDLHLSSISAYENGISTPNLNTVKETYAKAKQTGLGDMDFTAVYEYINSQN